MANFFYVLMLFSGLMSVVAYVFIPELLPIMVVVLATIAVVSILGIVYTDRSYNNRLKSSYPLVRVLLDQYNNGEISYLEAVKSSGLLLGEFNKIVLDNGLEVKINLGFLETGDE